MSRAGYFSPGIMGALAGLVYAAFGRGGTSALDRWLTGCYLVPLLFVVGQLLMLAAQGVFAGVLPVPPGKSIRGTKCVVIGLLIVAGLASGLVTYLLVRVAVGPAAEVLGGLSLACWLTALGVYVWSLPTAVADFLEQEGA
ncbi:MAG: hypothetical protein V2A79_19425 [Planctomycetota bacterium]